MTTKLKNAFERLSSSSVKEQNAIADLLLKEFAWDESFKNSQNELSMLAAEAVAEYKINKTKPLNLK